MTETKENQTTLVGLCVVNTEALNAISEHLNKDAVGRVLLENLQNKVIRELTKDEYDHLNEFILAKENKKADEAKPKKPTKKKK